LKINHTKRVKLHIKINLKNIINKKTFPVLFSTPQPKRQYQTIIRRRDIANRKRIVIHNNVKVPKFPQIKESKPFEEIALKDVIQVNGENYMTYKKLEAIIIDNINDVEFVNSGDKTIWISFWIDGFDRIDSTLKTLVWFESSNEYKLNNNLNNKLFALQYANCTETGKSVRSAIANVIKQFKEIKCENFTIKPKYSFRDWNLFNKIIGHKDSNMDPCSCGINFKTNRNDYLFLLLIKTVL